MHNQDDRTKKALRKLHRHPTITMKALAQDLGVCYRTVASWSEPDGPVPTLAQVRTLIQAAARYDGAAAREMAAELFGLPDCGWIVVEAPTSVLRAERLVAEVLGVGAAVGAVQDWAVGATADGRVDSTEADQGDQLLERVIKAAAAAHAKVHSFKAPQLAWRQVIP